MERLVAALCAPVVMLIVISACSSTARPPVAVVGGHRGPLAVPFEADRRALLVEPGNGPVGVARRTATTLALHMLNDDNAAKAAEACAGCAVSPARIEAITSGQVTVSHRRTRTTGRYRSIVRERAWVIRFESIPTEGCPFNPGRILPPSPSELDLLIVTGSRPTQIAAFYGVGTGCRPRTKPEVNYSPVPGQFVDVGGP